jgi:outer membrane protein assembly factor BamD (BamD/ComL family)
MRCLKISGLLLIFTVVSSCGSGPVKISETITPAELIQRGQEASDRNRHTISLQYYEAILEKFPENNDYVCAAEYEIAFIHYKQKKYGQAKAEFQVLLDRYNTTEAELLPPQYRVLSTIVLAGIDQRTK